MIKNISHPFLSCYVLAPIFSAVSNIAASAELRYLKYDDFQLVVDCEQRSAIQFSYMVGPDAGNLERKTSFKKDPNFSTDCQQFSGSSYSDSPEAFDRGHLVPANHLDNIKIGIKQSNYMTNVLPQSKKMNRGAWLRTEKIIECYREFGVIHVYGGPVYGTDRSRDFFTEPHGVRTPVSFWKVIISENDHIAWIIPNTSDATQH